MTSDHVTESNLPLLWMFMAPITASLCSTKAKANAYSAPEIPPFAKTAKSGPPALVIESANSNLGQPPRIGFITVASFNT